MHLEKFNGGSLPRDFYLQDTIEVARQLIGKELVYQSPGQGTLSGIIVETEAYLGNQDPACHSFNNRFTPRTQTMFKLGGHSYVYFIYGMYHCFNVVTMAEGVPEAVLIRALEPSRGIEQMQLQARPGLKAHQLLNGPGKLCKAMGLNREHDGWDLCQSRLFIREATGLDHRQPTIETSPRVGIDSAGDAALWPLRFFWSSHPSLSPVRFL